MSLAWFCSLEKWKCKGDFFMDLPTFSLIFMETILARTHTTSLWREMVIGRDGLGIDNAVSRPLKLWSFPRGLRGMHSLSRSSSAQFVSKRLGQLLFKTETKTWKRNDSFWMCRHSEKSMKWFVYSLCLPNGARPNCLNKSSINATIRPNPRQILRISDTVSSTAIDWRAPANSKTIRPSPWVIPNRDIASRANCPVRIGITKLHLFSNLIIR
jgi:hypothetical protein